MIGIDESICKSMDRLVVESKIPVAKLPETVAKLPEDKPLVVRRGKEIRVALLLSGQPRFYSGKSYDSIKREILDKYSTDVFIHTWRSNDGKFDVAPWVSKQIGTAKFEGKETTYQDILRLYNPKRMMIEESREFKDWDKIIPDACLRLRRNLPSMLYSLTECWKQVESSPTFEEYDIVVRARFDTLIEHLPDFTIGNIDDDKNYPPNKYLIVPDNCPNHLLISDNFSLCTKEIAKKVYNIWNELTAQFIIKLWKEKTPVFMFQLGDEIFPVYPGGISDFEAEKVWYHFVLSKTSVMKDNEIKQDLSRTWSKFSIVVTATDPSMISLLK